MLGITNPVLLHLAPAITAALRGPGTLLKPNVYFDAPSSIPFTIIDIGTFEANLKPNFIANGSKMFFFMAYMSLLMSLAPSTMELTMRKDMNTLAKQLS